MAIIIKAKRALYRLQTLIFNLQRLTHTLAEGGGEEARIGGEISLDSVSKTSGVDISKWKKVDSRILGIKSSMISPSSWTVLKNLQNRGFEAYLVGGCVRDLLLKRTPKDFDVITTAELRQVRQQFHHAIIVGRRFPICMVHIKNSVVEVSSFKHKESVNFSQMVIGCDKKDFVRWRDSMKRDFTINSLLYDPFANKIYDYANGMTDLCFFKLQTVIPAQMSFIEDCARILRGVRIAARLGLSISEETKEAIQNLSSSIKSLSKSRLMMELNFMLSYGAAESSICLLNRFDLLQILLPFHAAYLAQQANNYSAKSSIMLMKLFSSVDKLLACDRPSHCSLWVGLLAFHLALVNNPQNALVVWTFSSVMYHGNWREAVKVSRENAQMRAQFVPEISEADGAISDEALAEEVTRLALLVKSSIHALINTESLLKSMSRYPGFPCSGLVLVSPRMGAEAAKIFDVQVADITSYRNERKSFEIDYKLLGKGDQNETRFVLGKVIMDTMRIRVALEKTWHHAAAKEEKHHVPAFNLDGKQEVFKKEKWDPALSNLDPLRVIFKEEQQHCQEVVKNEEQNSVLLNLEQYLRQAVKEETECCLPVSSPEQQQKTVRNKEKAADKKSQKLQTEMAKGQKKLDLKQQKTDENLPERKKAERQSKMIEKCMHEQQNTSKKQQKMVEKKKHHMARQETVQKQPKAVEKSESKRKQGTIGKIQKTGKKEYDVAQQETTKKQQKEVEKLPAPKAKQEVVTGEKQEQKLVKGKENSHRRLSSLFM